MNENQKKPGKLSRFFEEKGFYIILFLCIAAIGIAGYVLFLAPDSGATAQTADDFVSAEPVIGSSNSLPHGAPSGGNDGGFAPSTPSGGKSESGGKTTVIDITDAVQTDADKSEAVETVKTQPPQSSDAKTDSEGSKSSGNAAKDTPKESSKDSAKTSPGGKSASGQNNAGSAAPTFFVKPVAGEVLRAFCVTELVYDRTMGDWRTHNGADFSAAAGETVSAVADGVVAKIEADDFYGTTVVISHGGGLESYYFGLAAQPTVKEGDSVAAGDVIGSVGSGSHFESLEPVHLHLEMKSDGKYVDPLKYLG